MQYTVTRSSGKYQVVLSSSRTSNGAYSDVETNSATIASAPTSGKAIANFTSMTKARYYKAKVRVCDQDGTSNCTSYSSPSSAFALPVKLAKPTNLYVEPKLFRKARIKWDSVANVGSYTIKQTGSQTADLTGINTTYKDIPLDSYLADNTVDTFRVKAVNNSALYEDSDYSDTIRIVDSPILRADGDNSSLASTATTGSAIVKWTRASGASNYSIRYREVGGNHTGSTWNRMTFGSWSTVTPSSSARTHTISGLTLGRVYAIQLNYEQNGQKVFSGRDAYVWPSRGFPALGKRVATYPYFGHWPDREFTYRICENTFPESDKDKWVDLINEAFEQWETATDDLITVTHDTTIDTCASPAKQGLIYLLVKQYPHRDERLNTNDVYMVNDSHFPKVGILPPPNGVIFTGFIGDIQGICIFYADACAISKAYGSNAEASTELSNAAGSENGVDILLRKSSYATSELEKPSSVKFNQCPAENASDEDSVSQYYAYEAYEIVLHEAGHALGTSGAVVWEAPLEDAQYRRAHPFIPSTVMNYDHKIRGVSNEPDCSPHPFDILAIWALYQTVDR